MNNKTRLSPNPDEIRASGKKSVLSGDEVKTRLRERGETLKSWASKNGYPYQTVSDVVRGKSRCNYGMGHRIAIALGMKTSA
jgi:gp16 family phage-associated protein